ncbi:hypothetical protein [Tropicibacter sp. S64]|uniref:hypothetical protein n=1 Tax=Tropicibacter sp. S64 TaxID=3415122 RepID=UPI003C7C8827
MATQRFQAGGGAWSASSRITAQDGTAVLVTNTTTQDVYWAITEDDAAPAFAVHHGHPVAALASQSFELLDGERLWLAASGTEATLTLTTGAA